MKKTAWIMILVALIIVIPIAWYLASPLFLDTVVNEDLPNLQNNNNANVNQDITNNEEIPEEQAENTILYEGSFMNADSFHKVEGQAKIIESEGTKYIRFENFQSTNGPDLKVYLATDTSANTYVSLGDLKGNIGNQNYEIPEDANLNTYDNVLIWCEQFSVLFGHAELEQS